ncbi:MULTISPECIES: HesB/IscA family protein [Pseudovibrio]|uniref:HesB/IscA family protein n=1 Tax=Stappiaceae TaxID=2821832 RepID=UPI0023651F82|nr:MULTISPECIES: iron-sulfur cluster assembly accessory protein [Pseudovibrio]MDD7908861.1 iron-sulfur cluster assembly accessory protein [Pseudovibrio exalbescens]MDX5593821.1 iron-sulfur cluster assembly accessory protein [Pseudovibrio sp. SPO723]
MMNAAKFQVLSLTDEAAEQVRELLSDADGALGLRIGVKKGGCAGMEYDMSLAFEHKPGDDLVEDKGVKVFVDPSAVLYLLGTEMGFETTKFRSGFTFKNPNEVSACGCGESVELRPSEGAPLAN